VSTSSSRLRDSLDLRARVESGIATGETAKAARSVLERAQVGHLAMAGDGWPYLVPLCFSYDGQAIHFHCGGGLTASMLAADDRVCLAASADTGVVRGAVPCDDTMAYESVLAFGRVRLLSNDEERDAGLRQIVAKYDESAAGKAFNPKHFDAVLVYRLEIEALTYRSRQRTGTPAG
jgi:nitroimidazol reductase NimA-like FMN-containing flavoprotein (pyridoxamine 5'-phosphate oxidase superfamily)